MLISSAVSTFYSTLLGTEYVATQLSTFTYSTFERSSGYLVVNYPDVYISSLTVANLNAPLVSTFSTLFWSSAVGEMATISTTYISTVMGTGDLPIISFDAENKRIGINLGNTPPRTTVDIGGLVYADGFLTSSDPRLKTDSKPLQNMGNITGYRFNWRSTGISDIGVMANEVENILPECVYTDKFGYKSVNYSKLVPYCLTLIEDLQKRVEKLEGINCH